MKFSAVPFLLYKLYLEIRDFTLKHYGCSHQITDPKADLTHLLIFTMLLFNKH